MSIYQEEFKIRYSEVNKQNVISPIAIMEYLQEIGCLHSDHVGMGLNQNAAWVIIQWKVKIISKPKWNEKITVTTWPSGIQGPYCMRDYEITSGDKIVAIGTSRWVLTDISTHKLVKITEDVVKKFKPEDKQLFDEPFIKLKPLEKYTKEKEHIIIPKDIDTNQHVNNIKYIELAYEMLPNECEDINYVEVVYKHSSVLGEKLNCYYNKEDEKMYCVTIKNEGQVSAIVKFGRE